MSILNKLSKSSVCEICIIRYMKYHLSWRTLDWGIRAASLLLTAVYGCLLVDNFFYLFGNPFEAVFWKYLIELTLKACLINIGLWLSTINFGRKHTNQTSGLIIVSLCVALFVFLGVGQVTLAILASLIHIIAIYSIFKKRSIT